MMDLVALAREKSDPAWDADRRAAFAVLLGMAFDLGFGPGGEEEAVAQARDAIVGATDDDVADLLAGDEEGEGEAA